MPRGIKYLLKKLITIIICLIILVYLVWFIDDVNQTRKRQLRAKGLLPPPGWKRVKQYYEIEPDRNYDYDNPPSIDIDELYKKNPEHFEKSTKDWIFFIVILIILMIYMAKDIGIVNLINVLKTEILRLIQFLIKFISNIINV